MVYSLQDIKVKNGSVLCQLAVRVGCSLWSNNNNTDLEAKESCIVDDCHDINADSHQIFRSEAVLYDYIDFIPKVFVYKCVYM